MGLCEHLTHVLLYIYISTDMLVPYRMAAVNLVVIVESLRDIITHKGDDVKTFFLPSVIAVAVALGNNPFYLQVLLLWLTPPPPRPPCKGVKLSLFLYCFSIRKHSSQVQVLWEDHRNDLFINGFGLLMSAGGSKWAWCMVLSL